jgi:small subunit ribosomal protein S1
LAGTVTKVVTFGAFVEILDGVEGLVHISELAAHHVENPREIVQPGDELRVKILEIDSERRRLSLSAKRVEGQVLPVRRIEPEGDGEEIGAADVQQDAEAAAGGEITAEPAGGVEVAQPEAVAEVVDAPAEIAVEAPEAAVDAPAEVADDAPEAAVEAPAEPAVEAPAEAGVDAPAEVAAEVEAEAEPAEAAAPGEPQLDAVPDAAE